MSDFHRSLDRALDHEVGWLPRDSSIVDSYDPHTDWGVGGQMLADLMAAPVEWRSPVPRELQVLEFTASIETIELLVGTGLIPLCDRKIPAEGTE